MPLTTPLPVPMAVTVDLDHGGRWTSWRAGEREWLWRNPAVSAEQRAAARPGEAFVDAGGAEECCPTIRGRPDHGDAWARPWQGTDVEARVRLPQLGVLHRRIGQDGGAVTVDYRISGRPGTRLVHAVHALLDIGPDARLEVPQADMMTVLDRPDPWRRWPDGLDRLGPDDGTAVCAVLPGVSRAIVRDGADRLELSWDCPARPQLCSLVLWRNLRGWPASAPYRSVGIEPMIGRSVEPATAAATDCAVLDRSGELAWSLRLSSTRAEATHR